MLGKNIHNYEVWNSIITMPYYNWYQVVTTGDLRYLVKGFKDKFSSQDKKKYKELTTFFLSN